MSAPGEVVMATLGESGASLGPVAHWLASWADRLNPILVKEARQALKSRQFLATFTLVLLCAWGWSLIGVALAGPSVRYTAQGHTIFLGYFLILGAALWVIIPFSAFRSLAQERDDRTFELLAITNLTPRQIVGGKLATALLQMVVYLSALAPCLAFTYLLRGIDVLTIVLLIAYAVVGCVLLSLVGLLLAAVVRARTGQVAISLVFVAGLVWLFGFAALMAVSMAKDLRPDDPSFWHVQLMVLCVLAGYGVLCFQAAASRLMGPAGNRSTALRWAVVAVQGVLAGCFLAPMALNSSLNDPGLLGGFLFLSAIHWYLAGVFLAGEPQIASLRLRRSLPQSGLGRIALTWFNPGPGTGYAFVLLGALATGALVDVAAHLPDAWWRRTGGGAVSNSDAASLHALTVVQLGYLAFYLGVGKSIIALLRRRYRVQEWTPVVVHAALLFVGAMVPYAVQQASQDLRGTGYSALQASNVFWTLLEFVDRSSFPDRAVVMTLVGFAGMAVAVGHLPGLLRELDIHHVPPPLRVTEEDAARAAALAPPPQKTSPWDE